MKRLAWLLLLLPAAAHAVVTDQSYSVSFTCTGSTGPYPFTFPVSAVPGALTVTQNGTALSSTAYSVVPVNNNFTNGGSVTLNTACPSGQSLTIARTTPLTQTSAFYENMPIPFTTLGNGLDKLTEIDQEILGGLGDYCSLINPAGCALAGPLSATAVSSGAASCSTSNPYMEYNGSCGSGSPGGGAYQTQIAYTPMDYGAKGNVILCDPTGQMPMTNCLGTGAIGSGSPTLNVTGATPFSCSTLNPLLPMPIVIGAAGTPSGGRTTDFVSTITTCNSSSQVTLSTNAPAAATATWFAFGTDDTTPLATCTYNASDDSQICDGAGKLFMFSPASTTTNLELVGSNGLIRNMGIIFAPRWAIPLGEGSVFGASGTFGSPEPITGPIANQATSFVVPSAGDASGLTEGQWLAIFDNPTSAIVGFTDFMQVSSVSSTTVNVIGGFRMAFPSTVAYTSAPTGLGFYALTGVPQNITLRDVTMIVPNVETRLIGLSTQFTIGITEDNVTCWDSSANCRATNYDKGAKTINSRILETAASEYTNAVDTAIGPGNRWLNYATQFTGWQVPGFAAGGPSISYGSGFGYIIGNDMEAPYSAGILGYDGPHDWHIFGNTFGLSALSGSHGYTQIYLSGGYNNTIGPNDMKAGSIGTSTTGIALADDTEGGYLFVSQNNSIFGNQVTSSGFSTPFSNTGSASGTNVVCNPIAGVVTCVGTMSAGIMHVGSTSSPVTTEPFFLDGSTTGGLQSIYTSTTVTDAFGTAYSSADVLMAYNALQPTLNVDLWHQTYSAIGSAIWRVGYGDKACYYVAPASTADATFATFFGTPKFCVDDSGNMNAAGTLTWGGGGSISSSGVVPLSGTGGTGLNQAACYTAAGPPPTLGHCTTVVSSSGGCTCVAN